MLRNIYERATVLPHRGHWITVNAFTDQSEPLSPDVLIKAAQLISSRVDEDCDLVLGEEDKGAHLVTAVALQMQLPLVLARWYVYPIIGASPSATIVDVGSEYFDGKLVVNGIAPGARIIIVDDTISTGGTLIALIRAVQQRGAFVKKAFAVVEKAGIGGPAKVLEETGVPVETFFTIQVTPSGVTFPCAS